MAASFFFYDLETSGFKPSAAHIMQFAGQRTDMELKPIGEPVNQLIRLSPDILPDPGAVLVTGITPQQTISDGITEANFLKFFYEEIVQPNTIFVGYNSIRFDDEFMRYLNYRNFYDAYEWQWRDGRSRWDLLDVVRMTRALRPDGVEWPFSPDGQPSNKLELLTAVNKLDHADAHDALSDVKALISVAKLIKTKQPKLFNYLLNMRDKRKIDALVHTGEPFVYSSGKYSSDYEKTTVAIKLCDHPDRPGALVYDLRYDPDEFTKMSIDELVKRWQYTKDEKAPTRLPIKALQFNRCPAVAPLNVLDEASAKRLGLDTKTIEGHKAKLLSVSDFSKKVLEALAVMNKRRQAELVSHESQVDGQLYDGFFDDHDKKLMSVVRATSPAELTPDNLDFHDQRLPALLPVYKARNFPEALSADERQKWDEFCQQKLLSGGPKSALAEYFSKLQELANAPGLAKSQQFLLEELKLYGESIAPVS